MELPDRLEKALSLKDEGNKEFSAGNYRPALLKYHEAFLCVHRLTDSVGAMMGFAQDTNGEMKEKATAVEISVCNNMSACHTKLENWKRAAETATQVLTMDKDNIKARCRRGNAHVHLGLLDRARDDFNEVLQADAGNKDALRGLHEIKKLEKVQSNDQKEKLWGFFDK